MFLDEEGRRFENHVGLEEAQRETRKQEAGGSDGLERLAWMLLGDVLQISRKTSMR